MNHKTFVPLFCIIAAIAPALTFAACTSSEKSIQEPSVTAESKSYFSGDGGKGLTLAVLVPTPSRPLTADVDDHLPTLVQGSLTSDFNRVSNITVIDRQNQDKILDNQTLSANGDYSDEDFISIGNLTNAQLILAGSITKASTGYILDLGIADASKGERKYSMAPKSFTAAQIESGEAAAAAVEELLSQMNIPLTDQGITELYKTAKQDTVNAEVAMSRGIVAQKKGTEIQALSYYLQSANYDPALTEAASRVNILTANITSGNMGENIRNDIAWRDQWRARLAEAEQVYSNYMKQQPLYFLVYGVNLKYGETNYSNNTVPIGGVTLDLVPDAAWFNAAGSVVRVVNVVRDGLMATGQAGKWGLDWPRNSMGNYPFNGRDQRFDVVVELVNADGKTIGGERITMQSGYNVEWWGDHTFRRLIPRMNGIQNLGFSRVNAYDITDSLTVRIASIDGVAAETAAKTKGINILREAEYAQLPEVIAGEDSRNVARVMQEIVINASGEITSYKGTGGRLLIPSTIFGFPVTTIVTKAFPCQRYSTPEYKTIGDLTSVTIPNSVTRIYYGTFEDHPLISITIPNNVTFERKSSNGAWNTAWNNGFDSYYNKNGKKAGTYTRPDAKSKKWTYRP
jgi:hypothetical protein